MLTRTRLAALASLCTIVAVGVTGIGISPAVAASSKSSVTCEGASKAQAKFFAHAKAYGIHAQEALYNQSLIGCVPLAANGRPKPNLLQNALRQQQALAAVPGVRRAGVNSPWSSIGPSPIGSGTFGDSGRILSMAWDAALNGGTLFVGTASGGVWSSVSPFTAWATHTDGMPALAIDSVAVDTNDATGMTLYAGSGEQASAYDAQFGGGVYKSTTGGASWSQVGGATFGMSTISKIVVDPVTGDVYAGISSGLYAGTGVFMSSNGGTSWTNTSNLSGDGVSDLAIDPAGDVYAAVGDSVGPTQTDNGIWECLAPCATTPAFTLIGGGAGGTGGFAASANTLNIKLAVTPISGVPTDEAIYAIASSSAHNNKVLGIFETSGVGATFTTTLPTWHEDLTNTDFATCMNPPPTEIPACYENQAWYDMYIWADPADTTGNTVYFGLSDIYKSTNGLAGGTTSWTNLTNVYSTDGTGVHPDQHGITSNGGTTVFFGNDGGAWDSTDGGTTFNDLNGTGPTGLTTLQFYGGALGTSAAEGCTSNCDATARIGGMQDNSTAQTTGGATSWTNDPGFGDGGYALIDPLNNNNRYGENANGGVANSTDGGLIFNDANVGTTCGSSNFMAPMALIPGTPTTLLVGMRDLCETTDATGSPPTWTDISKPGGTSVTGAALSAIAVSPDGSTIYIADDTGHTYFTTDNGTTWTSMDLGAPGGPLAAVTSASVAGPASSWGFASEVSGLADPGPTPTVYATVNGFQAGSAGHVFKWTNTGGANGTWTDISGNLPNEPYDCVVVNPAATNEIFVGGITGVFVTVNGGTTWSPMGMGLPNVQVDNLQVSLDGTTLVAFTHGRSAWQVTGSPTAARYSRLTQHISHGWTTMTWRSSQKVAGFNVYAATKRLNRKLITSHTDRYSFRVHWITRNPRLVAVPLL